MDRAALIASLPEIRAMVGDREIYRERDFHDGATGEPLRVNDLCDALEADAKKEAALKALCDDLGIGLARLVSGIRAIYGWNATTKDLHTETNKEQ